MPGPRLAIRRYGRIGGRRVLYHHGWPGAAIDGALLAPTAQALDLDLVAFDRPGTGGSAAIRAPGLRPVALRAMRLIDQLGWGDFLQIGVSGGAPFALATAALARARCRGTTLLGGMGPPRDVAWRSMPIQLRWGMRLGRACPAAAPFILRGLVRPLVAAWAGTMFGLLAAKCAAADRAVLQIAGPRRVLCRAYRHAFVSGGHGPVHDVLAYLRDWDLDLKEVRSPVWVIHGEDDRTVTAAYAQVYAQELPQAELSLLPGEGHFSPLLRAAELLAPMLGRSG